MLPTSRTPAVVSAARMASSLLFASFWYEFDSGGLQRRSGFLSDAADLGQVVGAADRAFAALLRRDARAGGFGDGGHVLVVGGIRALVRHALHLFGRDFADLLGFVRLLRRGGFFGDGLFLRGGALSFGDTLVGGWRSGGFRLRLRPYPARRLRCAP